MRLPTPQRAWRRLQRFYESSAFDRRAAAKGPESERATDYWANLRSYHKQNDADEASLSRSRWVADLVATLGIGSLLEVGTNSGRNLQVIREWHPGVRLGGIDVNGRAIEFARSKMLDVDFRIADANVWTEEADSWDAILTMSVLDHIPDDAIDELAANIARSVKRHVIAVELWDGSHGTRGEYKYSRNISELFERNGLHTMYWRPSVGQYDMASSPLWSYVGSRQPHAPLPVD